MNESKFKVYSRLLQEFKEIKLDKKPISRTFMQIAGYPHFENVCSNILAFFFTTDEEHGFNELFLKSLLDAASIDDEIHLNNVSVEREYVTNNNKRLDLVLTNDTLVIGVENKLFSGVDNDLREYRKAINNLASEQGQKVYMIILSLNDESRIAAEFNYINVTYDILFDKIKKNLGDFIQDANNTWLIYLKDFMKTILALKGSDDMNTELLEFVQKNSEEIGALLQECSEIKKLMAAKTKELGNFLDLEKYKDIMKLKAWCYNPKIHLTSSFVIDIAKTNNKTLTVETFIDPAGWHIAYFDRKGGLKGDKILESKLKELKINYRRYRKADNADNDFLVVAEFPHNASHELIQNSIFEAMDNAAKIELD